MPMHEWKSVPISGASELQKRYDYSLDLFPDEIFGLFMWYRVAKNPPLPIRKLKRAFALDLQRYLELDTRPEIVPTRSQ